MNETPRQSAIMALTPTSKIGKVRRHLAEIETQLAAGVSMDAIRRALQAEEGIQMTPQYFSNALYRCRKAKNKPAARQETPSAASPVTAAPAPEAAPASTDIEAARAELEAFNRVFDPKTRYLTADRYINQRPNRFGTTPKGN